MTVSATDPDEGPGGIITYSLVSGAMSTFSLDSISGTVRLFKPLDFEARQIYNITIQAQDGGVPVLRSVAYVIIEVIDVNENLHSPMFSSFAMTGAVLEGQEIGTFVMQVKATDEDVMPENSRLSYYIDDEGDGVGIFSIDQLGKS